MLTFLIFSKVFCFKNSPSGKFVRFQSGVEESGTNMNCLTSLEKQLFTVLKRRKGKKIIIKSLYIYKTCIKKSLFIHKEKKKSSWQKSNVIQKSPIYTFPVQIFGVFLFLLVFLLIFRILNKCKNNTKQSWHYLLAQLLLNSDNSKIICYFSCLMSFDMCFHHRHENWMFSLAASYQTGEEGAEGERAWESCGAVVEQQSVLHIVVS